MDQSKLNKIIDNHKLWLRTNGEQGERANLRYADLSSANLRSADLRYADLSSANLRSADLRSANLRYANLRSANLDYSAFPLWCGGLDVHIDDKQATQLMYHLIRNVQYSKNTSEALKKICRIKSLVKQANQFHRVKECGEISENDTKCIENEVSEVENG
jgi:uncharacterized protein YjbI with pentapeptide repeats